MKIWITRDEDGRWRAWYSEPQLRPVQRMRQTKEGTKRAARGEFVCEVESWSGSDVESFADIVNVDPSPGEKVLVEVKAGVVWP